MRVKVPTRIGPCYPRCTPTYGQGGSGSRSHRLVSGLIPGGVPGNGLLNNLIAYWPGDEVAGNLIDAHTNGLDLTDTNTVTSNPGLVYPLARQYTAANTEYHARASEALLEVGDLDFTIAQWLRFDSLVNQAIVSKWRGSDNSREYELYNSAGVNRLRFAVSSTGVGVGAGVNADTLGVPVINTWYLVIIHHDSVSNEIGIQVDNGIVDTALWAGGVRIDDSEFRIGAHENVPSPYAMNGRIQSTVFWKSAAGAGGVLTAEQRTALYNGGAGLTYAELTT